MTVIDETETARGATSIANTWQSSACVCVGWGGGYSFLRGAALKPHIRRVKFTWQEWETLTYRFVVLGSG
jgi:hypothetical protein